MSAKYNNSPIIESLCEFRFNSEQRWDWTIPGLVYGKIKSLYPNKNEVRNIDFRIKPSGTGMNSQISQGLDRMQFLNKENNRLIQVGENLLVINHLKPYDTWTEFKANIKKSMEIYSSIAEPSNVKRIGLRYINHFEIPIPDFKYEDYFKYYIQLPNSDTYIIRPYIRCSIPVLKNQELFMKGNNQEDIIGQVNLIFATNNGKDKDIHILDLDFSQVFKDPNGLNLDEAIDFVEIGHNAIIKLFEESITNKLKVLIT